MKTKHETTYTHLKQELQEIKEAHSLENISEAFAMFFLKMQFGLNDQDSLDCITDGGNDNGIDAVYFEDDKIAHFFQFKFPGSINNINKGLKEDSMNKLTEGFKNFISNKKRFNKVCWNTFLVDKKLEYDSKEIYDFKLWFVTFSTEKISLNTMKKTDMFKEEYIRETGNTLEIKFCLAECISNLYKKLFEKAWPNFKLRFKKNLGTFSYEDFIVNSAYCSLKSIYDTFKDILGNVFEGNVRYLYPKSKINDGIKETILNQYSNFHLLNNGITIVCSSCKEHSGSDSLNIIEGNIINGAQTVGTIINTLSNMPEEDLQNYEDGFVFLRIIEVQEKDSIINQMVYTLNTQNQVISSYIISNDTIIKKIQLEINTNTDFFLETKMNEFRFEKEKNPNFLKLAKNKIDLSTFIQVFTSFYNINELASTAKNNKASLFNEENIESILERLTYEDSLYSYETYLELMKIIKEYRAFRKNRHKDEILKTLQIKEKEIENFRFLNTGNIIILFTLGLIDLKHPKTAKKKIIPTIKKLSQFFKDEENIANATKIKESFDKIKTLEDILN